LQLLHIFVDITGIFHSVLDLFVLHINNQNSFVHESPWRWLMQAETCGTVCIL